MDEVDAVAAARRCREHRSGNRRPLGRPEHRRGRLPSAAARADAARRRPRLGAWRRRLGARRSGSPVGHRRPGHRSRAQSGPRRGDRDASGRRPWVRCRQLPAAGMCWSTARRSGCTRHGRIAGGRRGVVRAAGPPCLRSRLQPGERRSCSARAAGAGCGTIGGLEMLVGQAVEQFEWWTGAPAPADVMRRAAAKRLAEFTPS